jgi:hypothetical protein
LKLEKELPMSLALNYLRELAAVERGERRPITQHSSIRSIETGVFPTKEQEPALRSDSLGDDQPRRLIEPLDEMTHSGYRFA